jgi:hypothetical protein
LEGAPPEASAGRLEDAKGPGPPVRTCPASPSLALQARSETPILCFVSENAQGIRAVDGRAEDDLRLGDLVVLMAEPGPFIVVEIDPPVVTVQSPMGQRRRVRDVALRRVTDEPPVNR